MNKVLFLMLSASVAMNVYLVNVEVVVKDELDQEYAPNPEKDQITIAQAGVRKDKNGNLGKKQSAKKPKKEECSPKVVEKIVYKTAPEQSSEPESQALRTITENDLESMSNDQMRELAQDYREDWRKKSKEFFEYRLGLSPSQQSDYERLKLAMEDEIAQMFQRRGDVENEPRVMTPEEMAQMGRIHEKYADKLKTAFGPAAYEEYISFRQRYNRGLAQESRGMFGVNF